MSCNYTFLAIYTQNRFKYELVATDSAIPLFILNLLISKCIQQAEVSKKVKTRKYIENKY